MTKRTTEFVCALVALYILYVLLGLLIGCAEPEPQPPYYCGDDLPSEYQDGWTLDPVTVHEPTVCSCCGKTFPMYRILKRAENADKR